MQRTCIPAAVRPCTPRRRPWALFAKNFFRHPRMLGSLVPSSRFLIERLLSHIDWEQARVIVEYGPGVGSFTGEILRLMRPDAILIAVETNPEFVEFLRYSFPDPRLRVFHCSASEIETILAERGLSRVDYVVSGIPLSTISEQNREDILQSTHRVLQPSGALLVYQFSPRALTDLRRIYSRVTRSFEPLNVLPAQVFCCAK